MVIFFIFFIFSFYTIPLFHTDVKFSFPDMLEKPGKQFLLDPHEISWKFQRRNRRKTLAFPNHLSFPAVLQHCVFFRFRRTDGIRPLRRAECEERAQTNTNVQYQSVFLSELITVSVETLCIDNDLWRIRTSCWERVGFSGTSCWCVRRDTLHGFTPADYSHVMEMNISHCAMLINPPFDKMLLVLSNST